MFDEDQLDQEILAAVHHAWMDQSRPLLLSQLGLAALSEAGKRFVSDNGISLKRHILRRLSDQVRFVPMPRQGGGLAPIPECDGMSDADLQRAFDHATAASLKSRSRPRYDRTVWRAFSENLPADAARALNLTSQPPTMREIPASESVLPHELRIEAHDTAIADAPDGGVTPAAVEKAILTWAHEANVEPATLIFSQARPENIISNKPEKPTSRTVNIDDSFIGVLKSLPKADLARLSFPGDVLLSIVERLSKK